MADLYQPKYRNDEPDRFLANELTSTLYSHFESLSNVSYSDMQGAVYSVLKKFKVELRKVPVELRWECYNCEGAGKFVQNPAPNTFQEDKCEKCNGKGWVYHSSL